MRRGVSRMRISVQSSSSWPSLHGRIPRKDCSTRNSSTSHSLETLKKRGDELEYIGIRGILYEETILVTWVVSQFLNQAHRSYIYVKYDHEKYIVHIREEKLTDKKLHIWRWNSTVVLNSLKYFKFFRYFRVILISIMIHFIIIRNRCFKFLFRGILFVYRFDRGRHYSTAE